MHVLKKVPVPSYCRTLRRQCFMLFGNTLIILIIITFKLTDSGIPLLNPYHAEFLKWNNPPSIFGTVHYHFRDIKMKT